MLSRDIENLKYTEEKKKNTYEIHIFDALGFPKAHVMSNRKNEIKSKNFTVKDIVDQYRKDLEDHELNVENLTDHQILISILSSVRNTINEHITELSK